MRDLVGRAVERALLARFAGVGERHDARFVLAVGRIGNRREAPLRFEPALERGVLVGLILGDEESARDADIHRIENAALRFHGFLEDRDALADRFDRGELIEQKIIAARRDLADRMRIAGRHPHRRMRLLRRRRLDDDVLEAPELAVMREALLRRPGLHDHVERFIEARVGFLDRQAEAGEFVVPIALADAEIEPAAGQQIDGRRLLGDQNRIVPGQNQNRRAEPQRLGLRRHPGEQRQACRDLAEAGEMMLDQKARVIAERLGLDIVVDELLIALAGIDVRPTVTGGGAAEKTEPHSAGSLVFCPWFSVLVSALTSGCGGNVAHGPRREL